MVCHTPFKFGLPSGPLGTLRAAAAAGFAAAGAGWPAAGNIASTIPARAVVTILGTAKGLCILKSILQEFKTGLPSGESAVKRGASLLRYKHLQLICQRDATAQDSSLRGLPATQIEADVDRRKQRS